ncbi:MAG: hypothetical protein KGJ19_07880 [Betaproteobacteria bacterium]|nr:hypothetical protein [Betaproteobacteria bacterium]
MSRLLFLLAVIAIIYWLLKSYRKQLPKEDTTSMQAEDMVRCVHCGVHLPKRESIQAGDKFYCSEEHRRMDAGKSE